jgi:hypothetical protein
MALGRRVGWLIVGSMGVLLACENDDDTTGERTGGAENAPDGGKRAGGASNDDDAPTTNVDDAVDVDDENTAEPSDDDPSPTDGDTADSDTTAVDDAGPEPAGPQPSVPQPSVPQPSAPEANQPDTANSSDPDASAAGGLQPAPPFDNPLSSPLEGPAAGNPEAPCAVPEDAAPADTSAPDRVVGAGSKESCTADEFIEAVAQGGVITFDCGPDPVTITLDRPAKVFNDASERVVIDGGGLVTLSGGGTTRILYMNTCDEAQVFTTPHCDNQEFPQLTVQNLTFIDANSKNETERDGGGAIFASGGRFKVINSRFFRNVCADVGPDVGGAAIRVFQQFESRPVYVVNTTFGGAEGLGNTCSNGGGISSIGVNWSIYNSVFSHNFAIGEGGNPAQDGTPGGGSGGAIYNDGGTLRLSICGSRIENNASAVFGSAIFFVSNNHQGTLQVQQSTIRGNTGGGWDVLPGISMHDDTVQEIDASSIIE